MAISALHAAALLLATLTIFGTTESSAFGQDSQRKPNVLMICVDDLNDWVEPLGGHPQARTPAMQSLADRGLTFTNAHCTSPLCNSSRTSLMLSLRPSTTGIYGLGPWFRSLDQWKDRVTLPQHFRAAGYKTYTAGKVYHGAGGRKPTEFDVIGPPGGPGKTPPQKLIPRTPAGNNPWVDWGVFEHEESEKQDYRVASWVVEKLSEAPEDEPFFMACGFFLPHVPCHVPPKWWEIYEHDSIILPKRDLQERGDCSPFAWYLHWNLPEPRITWLDHHKQQRNLVHAYLSCIAFMDSQMGRVLAALEASPHADNTVICLWSDHGWHLGEKNITGKNSLWEPSTRVPLIFAGPGIEKGRTGSPASLLDVYPTLAELCDLPAPQGVEGLSLLPQIQNPDSVRTEPAITDHNPGNYGIRGERYRLIRYADGSEELYDVLSDPDEVENLLHPDSVARQDGAAKARHGKAAARLREYVRKDPSPLAPRSHSRILQQREDGWYWQGQRINRDKPPMSILPHQPSDLP